MTRLLDVANAAGVSLRTASRVLNDDPRVAPDTRQRVQEAISELSFSPDAMARSLRAGTDTAIGFVVESIAVRCWSRARAGTRTGNATWSSGCYGGGWPGSCSARPAAAMPG